MATCIDTLRAFANGEMCGTDLAGYAARDAAEVLMADWESAVDEDSGDPLISDVDQVIARLQRFRDAAAKELPVANGGLAGFSLAQWKIRLSDRDIEIYPCPQHRISRFGFTGCEDADYTSEDNAIKAAVAHHFG
jgi:hypothetical protein